MAGGTRGTHLRNYEGGFFFFVKVPCSYSVSAIGKVVDLTRVGSLLRNTDRPHLRNYEGGVGGFKGALQLLVNSYE